MCPHKDIEHDNREIDEGLFVRIIREIEKGINSNLIVKDPRLFLFFFNEPLCDPGLTDKINFVKNLIPEAFIQIFTNGLQLHKYSDKLIESGIDLVYISLYGYDHSSFNQVTGLNITPEKYQEILDTIEEIKKFKQVTVASSWTGEPDEKKFFNYSSRAGFYPSGTLHENVKGCSSDRIDGWLNFYSSGELTLCCMDWKKEVIVGDITRDSLENIIHSDRYREIKSKAHGKIPSSVDFICKRCEWAIPDDHSPVQRKKLIITAASEDRIDYLIDFILSLRSLGGYQDEILVLNYGIPDAFISFFSRFNVSFLSADVPELSRLIVNHRLADIYRIIKRKYATGYSIALFDVDIWFQDDISSLFEEISDLQGCLYSTEFRPGFFEFGRGRGPSDPQTRAADLEKMTAVVKKFNGHLNAGMMAARSEVFISKLEEIIKFSEQGYDLSVYGMDQYLYNILFDFEKDRASGKPWNCVLGDLLLEDNTYRVKNYSLRTEDHEKKDYQWSVIPGDKAIGIHCYNVFQPAEQEPFRFGYLNHALISKIITGQLFEMSHRIFTKIDKISTHGRNTQTKSGKTVDA